LKVERSSICKILLWFEEEVGSGECFGLSFFKYPKENPETQIESLHRGIEIK